MLPQCSANVLPMFYRNVLPECSACVNVLLQLEPKSIDRAQARETQRSSPFTPKLRRASQSELDDCGPASILPPSPSSAGRRRRSSPVVARRRRSSLRRREVSTNVSTSASTQVSTSVSTKRNPQATSAGRRVSSVPASILTSLSGRQRLRQRGWGCSDCERLGVQLRLQRLWQQLGLP